MELQVLLPELDRLICSLPVRQHNPPVRQPSPRAWQFNQPRRKLAFSTKHGRRLGQHQQDLRRAPARANRKIAKGRAPQFTQGVLQTRSAFAFGAPTTPVIAVMASRGLFVFGRQHSDLLMGAEFGRDRERSRARERARERESKRERQSTQRVIKVWIADELGQAPLGTGERHPVVHTNQRALDWRQRPECTHTWITCG